MEKLYGEFLWCIIIIFKIITRSYSNLKEGVF